MKVKVEFQKACDVPTPSTQDFEKWIRLTINVIEYSKGNTEVNIRAIDEQEMSFLNSTFRGKTGTTNILSFPAHLPDEIGLNLLGDIAICGPIVAKEAARLDKPDNSHWAHLTIHGTLHLVGYDHRTKKESNQMENLEARILKKLGISNPYTLKALSE